MYFLISAINKNIDYSYKKCHFSNADLKSIRIFLIKNLFICFIRLKQISIHKIYKVHLSNNNVNLLK